MTVNADASEIPEGLSEADIDQLIKELEAESHTWPVTETPCHLGYQACDPSTRDSGNDFSLEAGALVLEDQVKSKSTT